MKKRRAARKTREGRAEKPRKAPPVQEEVREDKTIRLQSRAPMWREGLRADKKTIFAEEDLFKRHRDSRQFTTLNSSGMHEIGWMGLMRRYFTQVLKLTRKPTASSER